MEWRGKGFGIYRDKMMVGWLRKMGSFSWGSGEFMGKGESCVGNGRRGEWGFQRWGSEKSWEGGKVV